MSARREFNLFTVLGQEITDCDAEDTLTFSRWELSRDDPEGSDIGLNISFTIDEALHSEESGRYEIYYIPPANMINKRGRQKEKRDTINIAHCLVNTAEIRDLADWLTEQADRIDEERELLKNS